MISQATPLCDLRGPDYGIVDGGEGTPLVSVVIPTLNEAGNLPLLLPRIDEALGRLAYEVLVVDDGSRDGTPEACRALSLRYPLRLLQREHPRDGLGGAVLEGLRSASGRLLVVMDADLQHPPERIADLLEPILRGEADFVIGSRYVPGGGTLEDWGRLRRLNSLVATRLAHPFVGDVHDPMSGFFALSATTFRRARFLSPLGFKVGLELICKCRARRVREVPITLGIRRSGESKLSLREQFRYLEHLSRLYDFSYPRRSPYLKFVIVALLSLAATLFAMQRLVTSGMGLAPAAILAYPAALAVTSLFFLRYVRAQREYIPARHPWRDFLLISLFEWCASGIAAWWIAARVREPFLLETLLLSFACAMVVRYMLRKELMQDIRGLRFEPRAAELAAPQVVLQHTASK